MNALYEIYRFNDGNAHNDIMFQEMDKLYEKIIELQAVVAQQEFDKQLILRRMAILERLLHEYTDPPARQ
jgi:hypothetical protein